ncbi:glycosyltransferase [Telmatocola sphagniphila]|nr:glycosyltransferase [Telmatocola sphagniphila]
MIHTRAALGCALAREGHILAASNYLSQAVKASPFDRQASRAYTQTLQDIQAFREKNRFLLLQQALQKSAPQVVPQEHWFEGMILSGDELTSIIILCCNEAAYTRRCFESLLLHTRSPYELIVIDNGSTDETEFLLQEYSEKFGADRWLMIRNEHNLGFPKGVNQALKVAHGEYVVLLNNDTIVTADWLEALIDWQISAPDQIGLVGPVSNGTRAPQLVIPDYNSLEGISPFAALRKAEYQGHCLETERLTGFCLLGRKTLFDHLGGLDENFGTGFFEDDDLCVRTRKLGLKLLVALDVYIHHEGSCTFKGLKLDTKRLLNENFALFQKKWGDAESAGYRSQSPKAHSQSPSSRIEKDKKRSVSISLTMMVKNEEANLEDCLLSVRDLVDEMIVVDTGSQDRTREIAQRLGAKVYDFPWVDSFAAARNEGLKHATGDWVFWMDADDRVDEANRQKLKELFDSLDNTMASYVMKCLCVSDGPGGAETVVDHVRLFRRDPRLRWRFRVHEQILPDLRSLNAEIRWSDATIRHVGYKDPALRKSKLGRDRRLLELEIAENPSNPFTLFNLGSIHQELGEHQIALDLFRRSLAGSHPSDSIVRKLYALIVQAHRKLGQNDEAFYAVKAGLQVYPQDSELIFLHAMMLRERGDIPGAEACFKDLINTRESNHFASVDTGLRGYKARHNLAILYMEQGRFGDAQEQWQQVLESEPTFLPALAGFAEIAARLNNKAIFESYLQRMSQLGPTGEIEAESLWVRYYMNLNEFSRVRDRLFKAIEKYPQSVLLRTHLTHALLREGKDPQVAQKALLDLLELDPNNAEAKHNLLVLETVGFKSE